jgi:hypothetical protein
MSAAGVGCAPTNGHADVLRAMAYRLRAEAAQGTIPSSYSMSGEKQMPEATPAVIAAALERPDVKQVQHLLRKYSIAIDKIESVIDFDIRLRAVAMPLHDRIVLKSTLMRSGLLV